MSFQEKLQSMREVMSGGYKRPEQDRVDELVTALKGNHEALEYLFKRGLAMTTIEHFKLGYDDGKNAISIPVYKHGELINIRYRCIDPDTTKRYTQEKGCEVWLYNDEGISKGIDKGRILIVEGEFDLMSVWQTGVTNVVSPASGKESYGPWIELLDAVKQVYIAYDNDKPGKTAGVDMANRIGVDKCFEVNYPEGIKDANEYFMSHDKMEFKKLIESAIPYYKHQYKGVGDIIEALREKTEPGLTLDFFPYITFEDDWVAIMSGDSNSGKSTWALNITDEMLELGFPVLLLPFERGINVVGKRYLQVRYNKQQEDFQVMSDEEWDKMRDDAAPLPLYMAMPTEKDFPDTIRRAKRIFNIKAVVVDHLDYFIHGQDRSSKQADMMHLIKGLAEELQVIFFVVHHIKKPAGTINLPPSKEDLKGSSDIYQIAEVVGLLHKKSDGEIDVIIDKNKGPQGTRTYIVNMATGKFERGEYNNPNQYAPKEDDEDW